jgi:hypothetical protein
MIKKTRKIRTIDPDMPVGKLIPIPDFLPPPDKLILPKPTTVKVTISLSKYSLEFFKRQAKKHKTKYQTMIREVMDRYASGYQE